MNRSSLLPLLVTTSSRLFHSGVWLSSVPLPFSLHHSSTRPTRSLSMNKFTAPQALPTSKLLKPRRSSASNLPVPSTLRSKLLVITQQRLKNLLALLPRRCDLLPQLPPKRRMHRTFSSTTQTQSPPRTPHLHHWIRISQSHQEVSLSEPQQPLSQLLHPTSLELPRSDRLPVHWERILLSCKQTWEKFDTKRGYQRSNNESNECGWCCSFESCKCMIRMNDVYFPNGDSCRSSSGQYAWFSILRISVAMAWRGLWKHEWVLEQWHTDRLNVIREQEEWYQEIQNHQVSLQYDILRDTWSRFDFAFTWTTASISAWNF